MRISHKVRCNAILFIVHFFHFLIIYLNIRYIYLQMPLYNYMIRHKIMYNRGGKKSKHPLLTLQLIIIEQNYMYYTIGKKNMILCDVYKIYLGG